MCQQKCVSKAGAVTIAACVMLGLAPPDADGLVTWLGVRWRGVPRPLRRTLIRREAEKACARGRCVTREKKRAALAKFDGCGCIDALKTAWEVLLRKRAKWQMGK